MAKITFNILPIIAYQEFHFSLKNSSYQKFNFQVVRKGKGAAQWSYVFLKPYNVN